MKKKLFFIITLSLALLLLSSIVYASDYTKGPDDEKIKVILADFEAYAKSGMADWEVPGMAVAIVKGDKVIYLKAFGVREIGKTDGVTENTLFQIGSTSKAFTSALVAMMVDEGKVRWNDRVLKHLPDFMMYDPWVTREFRITDLMAQRSGMPPYAADGLASFGYDREYIIHNIRNIKPVGSFRFDYAYQNNLWLVAAELVEKLTGKSWEENLKDRIFTPLGMKNSSADMKSFAEGKNSSFLHTRVNGRVTSLPMDWPYLSWSYIYGPAGGINSDITDMAKWLTFQVNSGTFENKSIVSKENMTFVHSPQTFSPPVVENHPLQYYCQGWIYMKNNPCDIVWHNGGTSGFKTMIAMAPEAKVGIVVLSNLAETNLPDSLAFKFFDMYFGKPERDWSGESLKKEKQNAASEDVIPVKNPVPPMELNNYTGTYGNDIYGEITVEQKDKNLIITIGPKKMKLTLNHWNRDVFTFFLPGEDGAFVIFKTDYASRITEVTIDMLNKDGCGVFKRVEK